VLIVDVNNVTALHLATALDLHARTCRANGVTMPAEVVQFAARCWQIARGDQEGPQGPALDAPPVVVHPAPMLLTVSEAAEALRLSERKVKRLVAAGAIASVTIDSARRIRLDDLRRYVDDLPGTGSFLDAVAYKVAPASPSLGPAGRRAAGAGTRTPARVPASQPRGAA